MMFIVNAALFLIAAAVLENTGAEIGNIFTAVFCMLFGAQQAGQSAGWGPDMSKGWISAKKIFDMIEDPSKINACKMDENKEGKDITEVIGKIEFRDVWFRYPERKEEFVLKGLNLVIEPDDTVALVGESGCGKSTFTKLMMRFYDPDCGEILLDGVPLKDYNLHKLRTAVSLVMQEPIIFNYTISDNMLYGKLNASNKEIQDVSDLANCTEFVIHQKERQIKDMEPKEVVEQMKAHKDELIKMKYASA